MKVKVVSKRFDAKDICVLELADPAGNELPSFSAGAHIDVHVGAGMIRQYSLCNSPEERNRYRLGVLLVPNSRGGSEAIHRLNEGDVLEISEPKNHFPLAHEASHSVLMAGGIGVTPILSMAESLLRSGASFEMHYATRDAERTAFRDRMSAEDLSSRVCVYHDDAPERARLDIRRVVDKPGPKTHLYVCGPGGFIEKVIQEAQAAGWDHANIHREYFTSTESASGPSTAFNVKIASTGKVVPVLPEQSIVEALAAEGIDIPTSCEQGVCGTCITRLIAGHPDHRDMYLTDDEREANDRILPCCSRSKSDLLILDL